MSNDLYLLLAARDHRRAELGGGTKKLEKLQLQTQEEGDVGEKMPGKPHKWGEFRYIYDYENNGYTT